MKRAAEVGKRSVRCSEEPEELVATDGIAKRSPKLTPAGGAMFSVGIKRPRKPAMFSVGSKRPRKPEKLSKKEKGERATKEKGEEETTEEEGKKRSKEERTEEKKSKKRSKEKKSKKRSKEEKNKKNKRCKEEKGKRSKVNQPNKGEGVAKDQVAGTKRMVSWRLSQDLLDYLRTKEVMGYLATDVPNWLWAQELFGQKLKEEIAAEFQENREFDAHVLYQYRSEGFAEIKVELSDEDEDEEASDDEDGKDEDGEE